MTAVLTPAAPAQSATAGPRTRLWTAKEFNQLGDLGLFEGQRAFLMDGVILEWGPMNPPHAIAQELTDAWVRSVFTAGWRVRSQLPLHLSLRTDPFPDVAVYRGSPRDALAHPTGPGLLIEIADHSLGYDQTVKAERYAAAGVPDYWVLDVDGRRLYVLRDPAPLPAGLGATAYRTHLTLGPTDSVSPLAAPHATVRVADLLP